MERRDQREQLNTPEKGARTVYIAGSQIPTPQAIFTYWCNLKLGRVVDPYKATIISTPHRAEEHVSTEYVRIPAMAGKTGRERQTSLVGKIEDRRIFSRKEMRRIERMSDYLNTCSLGQKLSPLGTLDRIDNASVWFYSHLVQAGLENWRDPGSAVKEGIGVIDYFLGGEEMDPFKYKKGENDRKLRCKVERQSLVTLQEIEEKLDQFWNYSNLGKEVVISIPVLKKGEEGQVAVGETRVESEDEHEFKVDIVRKTGRLKILRDEKVNLGVIGPKESGKSTVVANLVVGIKQYLNKIKEEQTELEIDDLECRVFDFDVSTPDVVEIIRQDGFQGFEQDEKIEWSSELAIQVVEEFHASDVGIYIINTPGGVPDKITKVLTAPLERVMLLVAADEDVEWGKKRGTWVTALKENGIIPMILARSRLSGERSRVTGEIVEDAVTSFNWKKIEGYGDHDWLGRVGGRAVQLNREILSGNPFIERTVKLLSLDILPGIVVDKYLATKEYVSLIHTQYQKSLDNDESDSE